MFSAAGDLDRERLLETLSALGEARDGHARVVLTLRGDFYDRPLLHPRFSRVFVPNVVSVLPMAPDEIDYLGGPTDLPNVSYVIFAEADGSFLAGAAAALKSQTGTIGFVGGVDIPLIHEFQAGYEAGARWVDPSIEVRSRYLTEYFASPGSKRRRSPGTSPNVCTGTESTSSTTRPATRGGASSAPPRRCGDDTCG